MNKSDKKAIATVAKKQANDAPKPRKEKDIFSVYLNIESYQRLKSIHGRETSRVINQLIDGYLEARKGKT